MAAACRLADASGQAVRYPATARRTSGSSRLMGIGAAIAGVILDRCGYVPNVEQSAAAIRGILLMAGLIPAVGLAALAAAFMAYGLNEPLCRQIREELAARRAEPSP